MQSRLRRFATSTPIEPLARWLYGGYRRAVPRPVTPLERKAEAYDEMTVEVARRCLTGAGRCIDAGANRGDLLAQFIKASPTSTFIAFEPIPALAQRLRRRCPQADVRELALSDHAGTAEFRFLPDRPALSSLLIRPDREKGLAVQDLTVAVDTLDAATAGGPRTEFLKVDVEGAELDLFRGARRVLAEEQPVVVFECGGRDNLTAVHAELDQSGYTIWTMPSWLAEGTPLASAADLLSAESDGEFQFVAAPRP